ncbi:hypothetical protein [Rhizobium sp. BK176]|uniref:hypothetical protein n=1 Tax=Rhizobium sp. BK176 TaxID=2587071 RepID=UPI002168C28B|nr:hypothetical protein [Rhizobium sp. BK176]MCS4090116.1 hypothetical protein [Rhizobium sp. BK176]
MLIEYELPAAIRATPAKASKERLVLCRVQGSSNVREVTGTEAPIAGVIQRTKGHSKYRLFDGHLHAEVGRISDMRKGVGSMRFLRRTGIEKRLMERAHAELASLPSGSVNDTCLRLSSVQAFSQVVAHRLPDVFEKTERDVWQAIPSSEEQRVSVDGQGDMEHWRRMADTALGNVIVCDQRVWIRVPDPCVAIVPGRTKSYLTQGDASFYSEAGDRPRPSAFGQKLYWRDIEDVCFPITDWEAAQSFLERHRKERAIEIGGWPNLVSDIVGIKLYDPSAFAFEFETPEFRRLADRVSYLGTSAMRVPSKPAEWKKKAPEPFIGALHQLDIALKEEAWQGHTESALEHILDVISRLEKPLTVSGLRCDVFSRSIARGLERWADRPINLETVRRASNGTPFGLQR